MIGTVTVFPSKLTVVVAGTGVLAARTPAGGLARMLAPVADQRTLLLSGLKPPAGTAEARRYTYWLHYAEGSAMLPLLLALYTGMLGDAAAPLRPRIDSEIANNLGYLIEI